MGVRIGGKVERVDGRQLNYRDFVERYLKKNIPVLLTGLMEGWRACSDWVQADGRPNLQFFADHFGESMVQVADCCKREFTDQKRVEMSVSEFIYQWLQTSSIKCTDDSNSIDGSEPLSYLKDWHFVKEYPNYVAYSTPSFFLDDWLNLYLDNHYLHLDSDMNQYKNEISCADYRFVYMGPKGTWTPLHADVFRSYSWSANVCGRKYWLFLSPSECHKIFDRYGKNYVYDVYGDICEKKFPEFNKAMWSECMQESNEIIFVPSGWYHQVHNLEDTISINHNWFNSHNLSWVWNLLLKDYVEAKEYIEDIREICNEFERICQRNLAANTGMNLHDFFVFLTRFALANLTLLRDLCNENDAYSLSRVMANHVLSNIRAIRSVALCMVSVEAFSEENLSGCSEENLSVSSVIKGIMEEQNFHDLLCALTTTLEALCQGQHVDHCLENMLEEVNIVDLSCFYIGSPADLVKLIEEVIPNRYNLCN